MTTLQRPIDPAFADSSGTTQRERLRQAGHSAIQWIWRPAPTREPVLHRLQSIAVRFPLLAVTAVGLAVPQLSRAAAAEPGAEQLQEVVVTAEKRASTVQDTPLSLTAISGAD